MVDAANLGSTASAPPVRVVVTGAAGALGRRVVERLAARPGTDVLGLDLRGGSCTEVVDLRTDDSLKERVEGADVVVHLASAFGPAIDGEPEVADGADVALARAVLEAAAGASVPHLVVRSSALVYGAWPNNPVPLTEDSPLRPVPDLACAVQLAEVERLVGEWRAEHPGTTATVLRPAVAGATDHRGWLGRALRAAVVARRPVDDPPAQFLHLDDLADAVVLAVDEQLDGAFNVAPEGWLSTTELAALRAGEPRLRLPDPVADRLSRLRFRLRLAPVPPGILPYARHPWVVAADRLRAAGWQPGSSNAETYVATTPAGPWATLSPRRRQELLLGGTAVTVAGSATGLVLWLRRRARRR